MALEREVKLEADETVVLPDLCDAVPGARLGTTTRRAISDTYLDTADHRLARWGCTLRFREGDGWTAKIPVSGTGPVLERNEVVLGGRAGSPPATATDLVRSFTRGAPVEVVARFSTDRVARELRDADGELLAELADDRVRVETADGATHSWRELEVELAPGADGALLEGVVERLEATGCVTGTMPKLVRALGERAAGPPDVVEPQLVSDPTCREVIQAAIARSVTHLVRHVPLARLGEDIEGVHQARVATRRLRSDLRTFRPLLEDSWARGLADELRWVAAELGKVRDADVLAVRLRATADRHPEIDPGGAEAVISALERQRSRDVESLLTHLASERADRLFDHLVDAAADPMTAPQADDPAVERLGRLVRRPWRHLQRAVESLDPDPPIADLHRIRIRAKRARYAAEAVAPGFGPEAKGFAKSMARIQDELGELNDAAVAEVWLANLASEADRATAFAAGRLAQAIVTDSATVSADWLRHYRRAARKQQTWLR